MSVLLDSEGRMEKIMENVTNLEVTDEGIQISTLFEEPKLVEAAHVSKIDFLGGQVILQKNNEG